MGEAAKYLFKKVEEMHEIDDTEKKETIKKTKSKTRKSG